MKKHLFPCLGFSFMLVVVLACGLTPLGSAPATTTSTALPPSPTTKIVPPSPTLTAVPPSPSPTEPPPPSSTPTEVPSTPTITPSPMPSKPGDIYYTADFNAPLEGWEEYLVDARSLKVIAGDPSKYKLTTDEAHLLVELEKTFTWLYLAYSPITLDDVRIDATVENLGRNSNNVSLICRYSDLGWYEFNIANSGIYNILRYDTKSRNYFTLYTGGSKNIKMGAETNQYTGICKGDELTLLINDVETRTTTDKTLDEGKAGISFSSFNVLPITLELTEFVLTFP